MGGAAAVGVGTAVGLTETITVKKLQEMYDSSREALEKTKENFESLATKIDQVIIDIEERINTIICRIVESIFYFSIFLFYDCVDRHHVTKDKIVKLS